MPYGTQGIDLPYQSVNAGVVPNSLFWIAVNFFAPRAPLLSNLDKRPIDALQFDMATETFRPRTSTLGAGYTSAATSLVVADGTQFTVGDVLQVESERFLVTAVSGSTLTVSGAFEGTTQANHANATAVTLITNARTGGDVDQLAINRTPTTTSQYLQTVQHAWQVAGNLDSTGAFMGGAVNPTTYRRKQALQMVVDDLESAFYSGVGRKATSTVPNQTMKGLKYLFTTNNNLNPANKTAFKPSDLTSVMFNVALRAGGNPDTLLVGPSFQGAFQKWGWNQQFIRPRETALGVSVEEYYVPFMGGVRILLAPMLPDGAACMYSSQEVRIRVKRPIFEQPRGPRGDAKEGDVIGEMAIEVENESHGVWIEGVTGFALET